MARWDGVPFVKLYVDDTKLNFAAVVQDREYTSIMLEICIKLEYS